MTSYWWPARGPLSSISRYQVVAIVYIPWNGIREEEVLFWELGLQDLVIKTSYCFKFFFSFRFLLVMVMTMAWVTER